MLNKMAEKKHMPAIRFKRYIDEWQDRKLGDLGSVLMNKRIFKDQTSENGDVPFYKIGTFGREPNAYISRDLFEEYKKKYPYPVKGDLLISASGSIGKIVEYVGKDEYFQDSNIVWLQHDGRLINAFLKQFYLFVNWGGLEGSTIKRLYNKDILDTPISIPDPSEQTQIGSYFQNLDKLISLYQAKFNKLVNLKKAMLEKMFPKNGDDLPEIRFKGFTGAWEEKKLGDVADLLTGNPFESKKFSKDGIFLVRGMNVKRGYLDTSEEISEYWPSSTGLEDYLLKENDILIQMDGALIGKSYAKIESENLPALLVQRVTRVRSGKANSRFIYPYIQRDFLKHIGAIKTETAVPHLSLNDIKNFPIGITSEDEQTKIGTYFHNFDNLISQHQQQLEILNNLKKACLEKMFV
jgi:type I restriction enzyme S subunit